MSNVDAGTTAVVFAAVLIAVVCLAVAAYLTPSTAGNSTTSESSASTSIIDGVVTGYVTASPSQPNCPAGQSCDENMTGYSLVFMPQCSGSAGCEPSMAILSSSGHYSALLPAGTYTVTGLSPSCPWAGCSSAFPVEITVVGGMQVVENFDIDTGIR